MGNIILEGPFPAAFWEPTYRAALYAIIIKPYPINKPEIYRIIYFGETSNLSDRGFWRSHHKYQCFINQARSESNLYIGIYRMPNSTEGKRREAEQRLVNEYNLICNREESFIKK